MDGGLRPYPPYTGYSLPRPASERKSTGLGLPFVREVAHLHGGEARFRNHPEGGAEVVMEIAVE